MKKLFLGFVFVLLFASLSFAGPATKLIWDESPESYVEGYFIYYGTETRGYTDAVKIEGKQNTCFLLADIPFLSGTKYYIAVTAYTTENVESPYSNEVTYPVASAPDIRLESDGNGVTITVKIPNCP